MHAWRTAIADNSEGAGELASGSLVRWVAGASRANRGQIAGVSRSDDDNKNDNNDNPNSNTPRSYMRAWHQTHISQILDTRPLRLWSYPL